MLIFIILWSKSRWFKISPEKGGGNKIKAVYSNYKACNKCEFKGKCFTKNHRTITRYIHEVTYKVERLMASEKGIKRI